MLLWSKSSIVNFKIRCIFMFVGNTQHDVYDLYMKTNMYFIVSENVFNPETDYIGKRFFYKNVEKRLNIKIFTINWMKTFSNRWSWWSTKILANIKSWSWFIFAILRFPVFLNLEIVRIQFISNLRIFQIYWIFQNLSLQAKILESMLIYMV